MKIPRSDRLTAWLSLRGIVLAALCALATARADPASGILVEVRGLRSDAGRVLCDLFASAEAFPSHPERAVARVSTPIHGGTAACTFSGLAPGQYAVAIVHDENGNGRLDRIMGMPSEGVGASRDARGHFGPPRFEDAAVPYPGGFLILTVKVNYLI